MTIEELSEEIKEIKKQNILLLRLFKIHLTIAGHWRYRPNPIAQEVYETILSAEQVKTEANSYMREDR